MKTDNLNQPGEFGHARTRGHVGNRAGTPGQTFHDGQGNDVTSPDATIIGGVVSGDSDMAYIVVTGTGNNVINDSGGDLAYGDVVVQQADGSVTGTTTAQDTRPIGVVQVGGADGNSVSVLFQGHANFVNVTASVTAGNYAETSTTEFAATENASRREGSFARFTTSGTEPEADLFGVTDAAVTVDTSNFLTRDDGAGHTVTTVADAGSATTLDLSGCNWFDVTLTEACTFSFSNPPESGVGSEWAIGLRGDFDVTWPSEVQWRDTDGTGTTTPPTMSGAFNHVILTTLDGGTSYGAALDNGGGTSGASSTRWELAVIAGSPPDSLYADGDWLYIEVPV